MSNELNVIDTYNKVFHVAEYFLKKAVPLMTIENIRKIDPTIEELNQLLSKLVVVLFALSNDSYEHEEMKINARQCAIFMERIAMAVVDNEENMVVKLVNDLELLCKNPL